MIATISHQGQTSFNVTPEEAASLGYPADVIAEAVAQGERHAIRMRTRGAITDAAGDIESIVGTVSDATQLLLYGVASLVAKLATAQSLAEMRAAAEPFAELSAAFLGKVEDGSVKLPFFIKGIDSVVADIETRATAVADVMALVAAETASDSAAS